MKYKFKYIYHGHSCFELKTQKITMLFDPFFTGNTKADITEKEVFCDMILLTHAHDDHFGDAISIAQRTESVVIAIPEVLALFPEEGIHSHGMNLGGTVETPYGHITMVPAMHSSGVAGGVACGYVISFTDGPTVYYAGDTALFGDMKLIGESFHIDYAILPIGDNYTMGPSDAIRAAQMLHAKTVIPIHYDTWPIIEQDVKQFKKEAEEQGLDVAIVIPGQAFVLDLDIRKAKKEGKL